MKKLCKECGINEQARWRTVCNPCKRKKYKGKYKDAEKKRYESLTLSYHLVYMLPNENYYVGKTNSIYRRKIRGKAQGMDYSEMWELHKCSTDKEAREIESIYHDIGFPGRGNYTPIKYRHKKTSH